MPLYLRVILSKRFAVRKELVEVLVLEIRAGPLLYCKLWIVPHHVGGVPGGLGLPVVHYSSLGVWPLPLPPPLIEEGPSDHGSEEQEDRDDDPSSGSSSSAGHTGGVGVNTGHGLRRV